MTLVHVDIHILFDLVNVYISVDMISSDVHLNHKRDKETQKEGYAFISCSRALRHIEALEDKSKTHSELLLVAK